MSDQRVRRQGVKDYATATTVDKSGRLVETIGERPKKADGTFGTLTREKK